MLVYRARVCIRNHERILKMVCPVLQKEKDVLNCVLITEVIRLFSSLSWKVSKLDSIQRLAYKAVGDVSSQTLVLGGCSTPFA